MNSWICSNKELITMGALCENAIAMSAKSSDKEKPALAEKVSSFFPDRSQEREIETMCLKLLLQQQPVGGFKSCFLCT